MAYDLTLDSSNLVPGEYKVCLVLYEVDEFGGYVDLDAVLPAFTFEITDINNYMGIRWHTRNWGSVSLGSLCGKSDDSPN